MRSASLDRRVKKEASLLVREARAALNLKRGLRGKAGDLEAATAEVEGGLSAKDLQRVRHGLPTLDSLVDELIKRPPKSTTRDYVESIGAAVLIALALRAFVIEAFKIPSSSMYPTLEIGDHIFVNKFIYGVRIPWTNSKLFQLRAPHRGEVIVFMQPCQTDKDYIKRVVALENDTVEVRCSVVYVNGKPIPARLEEASTCRYEDYDDKDYGTTVTKTEDERWYWRDCSRYTESVADFEYDTFHDPDRPARDPKSPLQRVDSSKDFPLDNIPRHCSNQVGPEDEQHAAPNQLPGEIVVTKDDVLPDESCLPHMHYKVPPGHVFVMGDNRSNSNDSRFWGSVPVENIKGKALFIWLSYRKFGLLHWSEIRWPRVGNFVH
ncbi:MAG: signal peptidase [Deltaproteobacteria bacterium]|nr:signal peptidase [Deltaproteobacteria bacterium]